MLMCVPEKSTTKKVIKNHKLQNAIWTCEDLKYPIKTCAYTHARTPGGISEEEQERRIQRSTEDGRCSAQQIKYEVMKDDEPTATTGEMLRMHEVVLLGMTCQVLCAPRSTSGAARTVTTVCSVRGNAISPKWSYLLLRILYSSAARIAIPGVAVVPDWTAVMTCALSLVKLQQQDENLSFGVLTIFQLFLSIIRLSITPVIYRLNDGKTSSMSIWGVRSSVCLFLLLILHGCNTTVQWARIYMCVF